MPEQILDTPHPRRPWLAAAANLTLAPLGHVYAGAPLRGVVAAAIAIATGMAALFLAMKAQSAAALNASLISMAVAQLPLAIDAWIVARRSRAGYRPKFYNRWYIYLGLILALTTTSSWLRDNVRRLVRAYEIKAASMAPSLVAGDHVLADMTAYAGETPKRFDVVVFQPPDKPEATWLKRVIGLPGETVEIRNRQVWINGAPLDDPHAHLTKEETDQRVARRDDMQPLQLDSEGYFLMGDNRNHSHDSRFFGPISSDDIYGRVHAIYFSSVEDPLEIHWERIGMVVR
jgi:signal peptidase I